jgi:dipeptide/tripeptide permease
MAFSVISLIAGVVSMISPTIGAWVWENFSPQSVFYASAAINVLGSLPLFILWLFQRKGNKGNRHPQSKNKQQRRTERLLF